MVRKARHVEQGPDPGLAVRDDVGREHADVSRAHRAPVDDGGDSGLDTDVVRLAAVEAHSMHGRAVRDVAVDVDEPVHDVSVGTAYLK
jgi:hypothetical protein